MSKILNWVAKRYWWIIALAVLIIWSWEILEAIFPQLHSFFDIKLLFYLGLLLFIGWMLEASARKSNTQTEILKILEYKQKLSREFSMLTEWNFLTTSMARLPGTIVEVEQAFLFLINPLSEQLDWAIHSSCSERGLIKNRNASRS